MIGGVNVKVIDNGPEGCPIMLTIGIEPGGEVMHNVRSISVTLSSISAETLAENLKECAQEARNRGLSWY